MSLLPDLNLSPERKAQVLEELLKSSPFPDTASGNGTLYSEVRFEPKADYDKNNKKLYTFDKSLARLKAAGYIRHPRSQEVFGLLIADLENKLSPEQKAVAEDMLKSYGEWLSAAVERKGDMLTVYTDPEGLIWSGSEYVKQDFKFSERREFSVQGIPSQKYVDLNQFEDDLVTFLYTRSFAQLPGEMQQGNKRAQVYLPPSGVIRPVGRGGYVCDFDCFYDRASRGVVPSRAKK